MLRNIPNRVDSHESGCSCGSRNGRRSCQSLRAWFPRLQRVLRLSRCHSEGFVQHLQLNTTLSLGFISHSASFRRRRHPKIFVPQRDQVWRSEKGTRLWSHNSLEWISNFNTFSRTQPMDLRICTRPCSIKWLQRGVWATPNSIWGAIPKINPSQSYSSSIHIHNEYEKVAKDLPVFCVSSRAYEKLSGRLLKDNAVRGFTDVDQTEVSSMVFHSAVHC